MNTYASDTLMRAADRLEELALRASEGPWYASDEPMQGTYKYDVGTAFDLEEQDSFADVNVKGDADWIATMSPVVARPLVMWLRANANRALEYQHSGHALDFAELILGEVE